MKYNPQMAIDFFYDFDNATNPPWRFVTPQTLAAERPVFGVATAFYKQPTDQFEQTANEAADSLGVIFRLTTELVEKHFGDFGENLQLEFEDFAQAELNAFRDRYLSMSF